MTARVKSFVLRAGRMSNRQQQGLEQWLAEYALPREGGKWSLPAIFSREAQTIAEIGFGMGASLFTMAKTCPEKNFIGIEVHRAGIGSLVADLHDQALNNVRIAPFDAVEVFQLHLDDNVLAGVQIFFPDPWPKKRHHKRRLIQADFIRLIAQKIKPGGYLHCATDWQEYAEQMLAVFSAEPLLVNQHAAGGYSPRPVPRPLTKFEQRGQRLGHGVWDLIFLRH